MIKFPFRAETIDIFDRVDEVLTAEVDVPAGRDQIWQVLTDNSTWPVWAKGCRSCASEPPRWLNVGDTRTATLLPGMSLQEKAIVLDAPERWAMTIEACSVPFARSVVEMIELLDSSRDGETRTEIRWSGAVIPAPWTRPFASRIEARMADDWAQGLESLGNYVLDLK